MDACHCENWPDTGAPSCMIVIARVLGWRVKPGAIGGSLGAGFLLTAFFYLQPDTVGDVAERGVPFVVALTVMLVGRRPLN